MGCKDITDVYILSNYLVNVVVVAIALHDGILEVDDSDMEIDHKPLVRRVHVPERITLFL